MIHRITFALAQIIPDAGSTEWIVGGVVMFGAFVAVSWAGVRFIDSTIDKRVDSRVDDRLSKQMTLHDGSDLAHLAFHRKRDSEVRDMVQDRIERHNADRVAHHDAALKNYVTKSELTLILDRTDASIASIAKDIVRLNDDFAIEVERMLAELGTIKALFLRYVKNEDRREPDNRREE